MIRRRTSSRCAWRLPLGRRSLGCPKKPSCRHLETVMHFAARFTGASYSLKERARASCWRVRLRPQYYQSRRRAGGRLLYKGGGPSCGSPARPRRSRPPYDTRRRAPGARACRARAIKAFSASPSGNRYFCGGKANRRTAASHASHRPGRCSKYEPHASRRQTKMWSFRRWNLAGNQISDAPLLAA